MFGGWISAVREIIFRGQRVDSGKWAQGSLVVRQKEDGSKKYFISGFEPFSKAVEVRADSVGEFTGVWDRAGRPVFEGDVVEDYVGNAYDVRMSAWGFRAFDRKSGASYCLREFGGVRLAGTVFDEKYGGKEEVQEDDGKNI